MFHLIKYDGILTKPEQDKENLYFNCSSNINIHDSKSININNNNRIQNDVNNNINNIHNHINSTILDSFSNQVGGHCSILSIPPINGGVSRICKPLLNRELLFYQYILQSPIYQTSISPYLATCFGIVDILKQHSPHQQQQQLQQSLDNINNNQNNNNNDIRVMSPSSQLFLNISKQKIKEPKHPVGSIQKYLLLEDLTKSYQRPSIIDIKIGTRQKGQICQLTTSTTLGIRVCGMRIYSSQIDANIIYDRFYGRSLSNDSLQSTLSTFIYNNIHNQNNNEKTMVDNSNITQWDLNMGNLLIQSIIDKLENIKEIMSNQNNPFPFKLYSSSLLIIYEGLNGNNGGQREMSCSSSTTTSDDSYASCLTSEEGENSSTISDEEGDSCLSTSSDLDLSDSDEHHNGGVNINIQNNSTQTTPLNSPKTPTITSTSLSTLSSSSSLQQYLPSPIRNDVKMIDFAHAIPTEESEAVEDDGYLFGIENLINILKSIKQQQLNSINNNINNDIGLSKLNDNNTNHSHEHMMMNQLLQQSLQHHQQQQSKQCMIPNNNNVDIYMNSPSEASPPSSASSTPTSHYLPLHPYAS